MIEVDLIGEGNGRKAMSLFRRDGRRGKIAGGGRRVPGLYDIDDYLRSIACVGINPERFRVKN